MSNHLVKSNTRVPIRVCCDSHQSDEDPVLQPPTSSHLSNLESNIKQEQSDNRGLPDTVAVSRPGIPQ